MLRQATTKLRTVRASIIIGGMAALIGATLNGWATTPEVTAQVAEKSSVEAVEAARARALAARAGAQPVPSGQPGEAKPAAEESERLKRLKALTFDRRPSAILKAWSEPATEDKEEAKPAADAKATPPPAAPLQIPAPPATAPAAAASPPAPAPAAPADPAAAAKAQQEAAQKKQAEIKAIEKELKTLQRNVTLSAWGEVKKYLASIPEAEGKDGYAQMLRVFGGAQGQNPNADARAQQIQMQQMQMQQNGQMPELNVFHLDDIFGLTAACPYKLDKETVEKLGPILAQAVQQGTIFAEVLAQLKKQADAPADTAILNRRQCAYLLVAAGQTIEIAPFLPKLEEAVTAKDAEAINLLARAQMAMHAKERKPELLEQAWKTIQATLALEVPAKPAATVKPADDQKTVKPTDAEKQAQADKQALEEKQSQEEALKLAVEVAPKVREELGQAWLEGSFTKEPQRGMRILAAIGSMTASGMQRQANAPETRLKGLQLQRTAVEALLKASPEKATEWKDTLGLLAQGWQKEGDFSRVASTSSQYGPRMRRDPYGNLFYINEDDGSMQVQMQQRQNQPRPIDPTKLLEVGPSEAWMAAVDAAVRPHFVALYAQLYLKVSEEERAFPYIERLATTHPDLTRDLANEFIRVWTQNHDPNASRRYSNPYMFMYGYERKAESIPLTRSKQVRNLTELSSWVKRLRALPIKDLDESLFTAAFTTCHSSAEVYRLEAVEQVLGKPSDLDPKTLAQLVQQMRQNLGGQWRMPAEQEAKKTRRKQKDIEAEVRRGYEVAAALVAEGLKKHTDNWQLQLAHACLVHDENAFRQAISPDSEFSRRRLDALAEFAKAAELYAKQVPKLREEEQTADVYEHWFYAGLGASDLAQIDHKSNPDTRQPALIRDAIKALPPEAAKHHMDQFANALFTRMSSMKPTVKFRYLTAGFEVVGDHEQAREARKVYDYYKDLVTEIKLVTRIDGSASVGHAEPFGIFVELLHTPEIERESGGFGRYLQNQNAGNSYYYNYGRPTENYREKFKDSITAALAENFDVVSVTYQADDITSRAAKEYGWRVTPYAYVLLKPRGPQVDKLPALKMDLDFLDTSGFVILPINSPALPVDASKSDPAGRPLEKLQITQTLDERQAAKGKLVLEVKATGRGLVPPLAKLVDMKIPQFEVQEVDDRGVSVSKFDPDSSEPAIVSDRTWIITLTGGKDLAELPKTFSFPKPLAEGGEVLYQRYNDADLATVTQTISLEQQYGEVGRPWLWATIVAVPAIGLIAFGIWRVSTRSAKPVARRFQTPATLTPFSVLALLRNIQQNDGLSPDMHRELAGSIQSLERHYFADPTVPAPDLRSVADSWVARAK